MVGALFTCYGPTAIGAIQSSVKVILLMMYIMFYKLQQEALMQILIIQSRSFPIEYDIGVKTDYRLCVPLPSIHRVDRISTMRNYRRAVVYN
jgi:hypothetical protein